MRVNEPISSDGSRNGDVFTATLVQPIIVQGFVVARRGQTLGGRVAGAQKAGRLRGTSRLGVELTEITLADGQQLPVLTQLIEYAGGTSIGQDATTIATGTGFGAMIGGIVEGGDGAGVGALVGAAAATVGVLAARGRAAVIDPESMLTFRTLEPLTISTAAAPHAFQPVRQEDYEPAKRLERRASSPQPSWYPPPFYGGVYWPYWSTFYWPSVFVYAKPWHYYGYGGHHHHYGGHWHGRK